ncbi:MAG: hypothetical protein AAGK14_12065 [Verrucomicrobiota bacterium]
MIDSHHEILGQLSDYLNGRTETFKLPDLHNCPLHDWLGAADEELNQIHHEFHDCCEQALRLARTGRLDGARARLSTAYRLCGRLTQLITKFDPVVA